MNLDDINARNRARASFRKTLESEVQELLAEGVPVRDVNAWIREELDRLTR